MFSHHSNRRLQQGCRQATTHQLNWMQAWEPWLFKVDLQDLEPWRWYCHLWGLKSLEPWHSWATTIPELQIFLFSYSLQILSSGFLGTFPSTLCAWTEFGRRFGLFPSFSHTLNLWFLTAAGVLVMANLGELSMMRLSAMLSLSANIRCCRMLTFPKNISHKTTEVWILVCSKWCNSCRNKMWCNSWICDTHSTSCVP